MRQLAIKEDFASDAKKRVDDLLWRSLAALADSISDPPNTLLVFNPLSWQRSSLVELDLDKGMELVDLATRQTVPYEILSTGPDYRHVRFMALDVPSVGYKAYAMKPTSEAPPKLHRHHRAGHWRIDITGWSWTPTRGAVKSIFDKGLNKELVNTSSPYRFNQYLYVTGADQLPNRAMEYSPAVPVPELSIHGANSGRLVSVTRQPFGTVARMESQGVNTPKIETEVILFNGQKKIEFINRVHKNERCTRRKVFTSPSPSPWIVRNSVTRFKTASWIQRATNCPARQRNGFPYSTGLRQMKAECRWRSCRWMLPWSAWEIFFAAPGRSNSASVREQFSPT